MNTINTVSSIHVHSCEMGKKTDSEIIAQQGNFFWSIVFIFIAGISMIVHELFEGLEQIAPDYTTYEMFELIGLLGIILFLNEWNKTLKKLKKKI